MASLNNKRPPAVLKRTHEGAIAEQHLSDEEVLRRTLLSCMLWEDGFYESGVKIADRILTLAEKLPAERISAIAIEARKEHNLRHAPLLLLLALIRKGGSIVASTIEQVISRAD